MEVTLHFHLDNTQELVILVGNDEAAKIIGKELVEQLFNPI